MHRSIIYAFPFAHKFPFGIKYGMPHISFQKRRRKKYEKIAAQKCQVFVIHSMFATLKWVIQFSKWRLNACNTKAFESRMWTKTKRNLEHKYLSGFCTKFPWTHQSFSNLDFQQMKIVLVAKINLRQNDKFITFTVQINWETDDCWTEITNGFLLDSTIFQWQNLKCVFVKDKLTIVNILSFKLT